MNKLTTILSVIAILTFTTFAEKTVTTYTVSGKVMDKNNEGLAGANISVVGTELGASTDLTGEYNIVDVPAGIHKLRVSMMGYESEIQDVTVTKDTEINFWLGEKAFVSQPIIVTGSRTQQRLQDSPVSIGVVDAEQIAERNFLTADEAMRFVGGVSMSDDQVSIRNSTGYAKGVGSRVLVMIDGVPVLAGDTGEIKWDAFPLGQIKQVEVAKSASSALYGSSGGGGVINFITKKPSERGVYSIKSEFGVWDKPAYEVWEWSDKTRVFHTIGLEHSRQVGDWGIILSVEEKQDQSYRQTNDFHRGQFFGKAVCNFGDVSKLSFLLNGAYEDRGGGLEWKGQSAALEVDSTHLDDRVWSSKLQFYAIYDGSADGGKRFWNLKGYANYYSWFDRISDETGGFDEHYSKSMRAGFDGQYTFTPIKDNRFTIGAETFGTTIDANIFGRRSGFGGAVYAQDEITALYPFVTTVGVRGDLFRVNPSDDYEGELYGQVNPKIGFVYHITDNLAARLSGGSGFRMPTMAELFTEIRVAGLINVRPNPYLNAEQTYSGEVGINWFSGKQMLDIAGFFNRYQNMIEPIQVIASQAQFLNIEEASIFGGEATLRFNFGDISRWMVGDEVADILSSTDVSANYVYTKTSTYLPYRPQHTILLSANVNYWKHGTIIFDGRYRTKPELGFYITDDVVDQKVYDIAHNLHFDMWALQLKVSNLLNYNYIEIERNLAPIRSYSASLTVNFVE